MARQTFTEGQRVYVKRWGSTWDAAIVRVPEVAKCAGYGGRHAYYVTVEYDDTEHRRAGTRDVLNNRQHIIDEASYKEQERQTQAAREARERAAFEGQKMALDRYRGYALRIVEVLGVPYPPGQVENLAQALFVDFEPRSEWARRDRRALVAKLTGDAQTEPPRLLPDREQS